MRATIFLVFTLISALFSSCVSNQSDSLPTVNLDQLSPLPTVDGHVRPLRVAVAAIISPQGTVESYQPLLHYLAMKVERPVKLVQRRTYTEVNDLIRRNEVDLAFVCTRAYVIGKRKFNMELLAIPEIHKQRVYYAQIIARTDLPARSFAGLRGTVFAFTDPMSNTGYLYPNTLFHRLGERPETFFARTFFTYGHDNSIRAVVEGIADAASVDNLVLDYAIKREPSLRAQIRIIQTSPPFGMPPVVVSPGLRPQTKALLKDILLTMHEDPEGRKALEVLEIDRFVPGQDSDYDSIREMEQEVEGTLSLPGE